MTRTGGRAMACAATQQSISAWYFADSQVLTSLNQYNAVSSFRAAIAASPDCGVSHVDNQAQYHKRTET